MFYPSEIKKDPFTMSKHLTMFRRFSKLDPSISQRRLRAAIRAWQEDESSSSSSDQQMLREKPDKDTIFELMSHIPSSSITTGYFETSYAGTVPDIYLWIIEYLLTQRTGFNMNKAIFRGHVPGIPYRIDYTPLCLLCISYAMTEDDMIQCVRMMERLIDSGHVDINLRLESKYPALFLAALPQSNNDLHHNRALRCLLRRGADINITYEGTGRNVMFVLAYGLLDCTPSCFDNFMKRFNLLVQHGADVKHKDNDGNTLLMVQLPSRLDTCEAYVKRLVRLGVDVNDTNNKGETAISLACRNHDMTGIRALLDHGADQFKKDHRGLDAVGHVLDNHQHMATPWNSESTLMVLNELGFFRDLRKRLGLLRQVSPAQRRRIQQEALQKNLTCPITGQLMYVPFKTQVGSCYGRQSIRKWLRQNDTDPSTNLRLENKDLVLDVKKLRELDQLVDSYLERVVVQKQKEHGQQQVKSSLQQKQQHVSKRSRSQA